MGGRLACAGRERDRSWLAVPLRKAPSGPCTCWPAALLPCLLQGQGRAALMPMGAGMWGGELGVVRRSRGMG